MSSQSRWQFPLDKAALAGASMLSLVFLQCRTHPAAPIFTEPRNGPQMARVVKQSPQACTYHLHPGVPTPSSAPTCQQRADGELNKGPASALARGDTVVLGRVIDGRKERARATLVWSKEASGERRCGMARRAGRSPAWGACWKVQEAEVGSGRVGRCRA